MKTQLLLCSLVLLLHFLSNAQISKEIDSYLDTEYQNHAMPGFSVIVTDKNQSLFMNAYGYTKINSSIPFATNTVSPIGSLTKSLTTLAMIQLVDRGQVSLDGSVVKYLPEFHTANPDKSSMITIRMLLNNTSGLKDNVQNSFEMSEVSIEKLVNDLSNFYIIEEPGTTYQYSNIGFSIAGLIISKVTGQTYSEYILDHILKPLSMFDSSVLPIHSDRGSIGHFPSIGQAIPSTEGESLSGEFIPAGRYSQSTIQDLGAYLRMYLNKGALNGQRLVSSEGITEMFVPQIDFVGLPKKEGGDGSKFHYGLGWMISTIDGRQIVHHAGSTGKASSFTMIDVENELAASFLTNVDLTLVDRHQYAFGLNIINNVLHLANGEPITDFALPINSDPTINSYKLVDDLKTHYLGQYQFKEGGDNFVYYDQPSLNITLVDNGLVGTIQRRSQIVNQFELDFVNPSLAVSQNIASPTYIRFLVDKNGKVSRAYCFGMAFRKLEITIAKNPQKGRLRFAEYCYTQDWNQTMTKKGVLLTHTQNPSMNIEINLSNGPIITPIRGSQNTVRLNHINWQKQSSFIEEGAALKMVTNFGTRFEGQDINVRFISNASEHSYYLKTELAPFLKAIEFSKSRLGLNEYH